MHKLILSLSYILLVACGDSSLVISDCQSDGNIVPVCGFQNPEDFALLPDGETMLVSQMGYIDADDPAKLSPGSIAEYHPEKPIRIVFEGGVRAEKQAGWGDPECPGAPSADFAPHGIDLDTRADGRTQLLSVNHGGRESIEFFEVTTDQGQTHLTWRGCVVMSGELFLNDVVATNNGGFWATHMFPKHSIWAIIRSALGSKLGYAVAWSAEQGIKKLPGSDGAMPNGIEKSADEHFAYINMYFGSTLKKLDVRSGETVKAIELASPDNSAWDRDGKHLLVASHVASIRDAYVCQGLSQGSCGFAFEIVRVNSETMARETLVAHEGAPMGGVTVALPVKESLYLGTFAGDRIARIAYP